MPFFADEAAPQLNYTEIAQPALFTLQVSLVQLWHAWGIDADAVIGDSVGEIAAAYTAGVLDLTDSFRIILARSHRVQARTRGLGRMLAASISADDAKKWERKLAGRISIAAFNAPRQVTPRWRCHRAEANSGSTVKATRRLSAGYRRRTTPSIASRWMQSRTAFLAICPEIQAVWQSCR